MKTEALIAMLAADVKPVPRNAVGRRLFFGLGPGVVTASALVAAWLGLRPDLDAAMHGFAFWMKWTYTISLGIGAGMMVARLARPEAVNLWRFWPIAIPFALLAVVGVTEMMRVPAADRVAMWLGNSWAKCPPLVLGLSVPIFIGLLWSFRQFAPTRLHAAGAAAGLASGAWAAAVYCLHCTEVSAIFVLTWYTLGIALASAAGALLGPRLLRW